LNFSAAIVIAALNSFIIFSSWAAQFQAAVATNGAAIIARF